MMACKMNDKSHDEVCAHRLDDLNGPGECAICDYGLKPNCPICGKPVTRVSWGCAVDFSCPDAWGRNPTCTARTRTVSSERIEVVVADWNKGNFVSAQSIREHCIDRESYVIDGREWRRVDDFCPSCGSQTMWQDWAGGDVEIGRSYLCISCGKESFLDNTGMDPWNGHEATLDTLRRLATNGEPEAGK